MSSAGRRKCKGRKASSHYTSPKFTPTHKSALESPIFFRVAQVARVLEAQMHQEMRSLQSLRRIGASGLPLLRALRTAPARRCAAINLRCISSLGQALHLIGRGPPLRPLPPRMRSVAASSTTESAPTAASGATEVKRNPSAPTFQEAISRLQQYWASVGCAVWLPHNTEVGMRLPRGCASA